VLAYGAIIPVTRIKTLLVFEENYLLSLKPEHRRQRDARGSRDG
jgi:hypothetical protein